MKRTRYTPQDFAWATWTPKDIERVGKEVIRLKKERYAQILAVPATERTFENTIAALERSSYDLADWMGQIEMLGAVSPNKAVRDAATKTAEEVGKAMIEIEFDRRLFDAVESYASKKEKLSGADKLLFDDTRKGYARMGFGLQKEKQSELKRNLKRMNALSLKFDQRLNEYRDQIYVTHEELNGLPTTYINSLKKDARGRYIVSLDYPELVPFMSSSHSEERRKELMEKKLRKGGPKNLEILEELFTLRAHNAKLLGYKTYADFVTELRMAKSGARVMKFLTDLERKTRKAGQKDQQMLVDFKRKQVGNPKAVLHAHDTAYYFKLLRKELFDIDSDFVKEHFPFEHVKQATLGAYQKLLGVRFVQRNDIKSWHTDVQFYDVHDTSGAYLASCALDLYPRDGKYGHAAVFPTINGREEDGRYVPPLSIMVTNFQKPTADNPSLMSHGEVETFFHEFGHLVHGVLTTAKYRSQSGTSTAWDFVEAPSQMIENWVWDAGMLRKLSKHYKTGKPLPPALIKRMIDAKLFGEAWSTRGQLVLAIMDQMLHTKAYKDPKALYTKLEKELMGLTPPKTQMFLAGFGHIAHGYEAGYYGYLWSKVYAEDMFTRFAKEGVLNPRTGKDYRTWILAKGSSMEEEKLIEGFLGRKPNNKAFLKSIGV